MQSPLSVQQRAIIQHGPAAVFHAALIRHGLRFAELISITPDNVIDRDNIFVTGKKGSHDRYLYDPELVAYILHRFPRGQTNPIFQFSYSQFRRYLYRRNYFQRRPGKHYNRVSNLARANRFQKFVNHTGALTHSISVAGGHRSKRSTTYYLQPTSPNHPKQKEAQNAHH